MEKYDKLNDFQHARHCAEMYMGSREVHTQNTLYFNGERLSMREFAWVPALYTGFREIIDNALDEMIGHGHGNSLRVDYDPDEFEITVEDNGRGMPIHEIKELGKGPAASVLLGEARAGRNFSERGQVAGTNGLGAAIVNFTAEYFHLDIWRDGQHFRQKWTEGKYGKKDIHKTGGPNIIKGSKTKTGTKVVYKPSSSVFPNMVLPIDLIRSRLWDIAVANPNIKIYFNGIRFLTKNTRDPIMSTYFSEMKACLAHVTDGDLQSKFYAVPNFSDDTEIIHTLVNNIHVYQGGSHVDAFRDVFYSTFVAELKKQTRKENLSIRRDDIARGLLLFNVTTMDAPKFNSQEKSKLVNELAPRVKKGFNELDVKSIIRRNPEWVESILERCRNRLAIRDDKDVAKKQKNLQRSKVAALHDANGKDRQKCVLFLGEGESAIATMLSARDKSIHGGMALRGKVMNVHSVTPKKILGNKILSDIMSSIGLVINEPAVRNNLRYGSIYIATDEDEDGKNISALLINFFYRLWPELFEDEKRPFVYKFSTPFIILEKGKTRKYVYAHDYDEFQNDLDKYKGWSITRAKGLGTLRKVDWIEALHSPMVIPIIDDGSMEETLDLIFNGNRADDRKEWLSA